LAVLGSLAGVRNEADAKLLSDKQRQISDLQNQLKTMVSKSWSHVYYRRLPLESHKGLTKIVYGSHTHTHRSFV